MQELREVHIKSDSNNSRMNKIMCNKNVSSANNKDYWHPAWATELKMVIYSTYCSIHNDQSKRESKKELCNVWPTGKISSPFLCLVNSSFHGEFVCYQLRAQLAFWPYQ